MYFQELFFVHAILESFMLLYHYIKNIAPYIKTTLENKVRALFTETWSPCVVLSLTFRLNSHLECGGSSSLLIMPGLLRSDRGGLSVSMGGRLRPT